MTFPKPGPLQKVDLFKTLTFSDKLTFPKPAPFQKVDLYKKVDVFQNLQVFKTWAFPKPGRFQNLRVFKTWAFPKPAGFQNLDVSKTWRFRKPGRFGGPEAGPPGSREGAGAWNQKAGGSIPPGSALGPPPGSNFPSAELAQRAFAGL